MRTAAAIGFGLAAADLLRVDSYAGAGPGSLTVTINPPSERGSM